jgi:hypothetical protein
MKSLCCRAALVAMAMSLLACEDSGPASAADIQAFCTEFTRIAAGPAPCNTKALELARLADDKPNVRLKNLDALLRKGDFNPEERRAYDGCKSATTLVSQKCPRKKGPANALQAINGDRAPRGGSAEAWVKKGNSEDSGRELMGKALK